MIFLGLPAYNESQNLEPLLSEFFATMRAHGVAAHKVLIQNDGSTDDTGEVARRLAEGRPVEVEDNPRNLGLADTLKRVLVRAAEQAAASDVIVTMDADNTHPAGLIPRMAARLEEGNDICIASRYRYGAHIRGLSGVRKVMSLGAAGIFMAALPMEGVRDYTCGFRAYRAGLIQRALADLGPDGLVSEKGFSCMVDVLLKLQRYAPVMTEVPLVLRYDQKQGASKMKVGKTVVDTLRLVARRRAQRWD
jgi:dolichol-phosphate mannosyltransferase